MVVPGATAEETLVFRFANRDDPTTFSWKIERETKERQKIETIAASVRSLSSINSL